MHETLISIHGEEPPIPQLEGCTDRQWAYINDLAVKANRLVVPPREMLTKRDASELIESLKAEAAEAANHSSEGSGFRVVYEHVENDDGSSSTSGFVVLPAGDRVPAGRYAIATPTEKNQHGFFKLWIGDRGGWSLRRQVSDDFVPMERSQQLRVLADIARDPLGAAQLFGQLIGACGVCGRTLTNDESRAIGIGPVCAASVSVAKVGRPRRHVSDRKLMMPAVTGSPIYYRSSRGGSWRMRDVDLLYALDMYSEGEPINDICDILRVSKYQLYKNIGPYLERR